MTAVRRRRALAALGLVVAFVAAGCGDSGYTYVRNDEAAAFFKLPDQWTLFTERQILAQPALDLRPLERRRLVSRTWIRGFDSGPEPSPLNTVDLDGPYPRGRSEIRALTRDERSEVSLSTLRSLPWGFDPVAVYDEEEEGPVEILGLRDVTFPGGRHGVRMQVAIDAGVLAQSEDDVNDNHRIVVADYTAVLDADTRLMYLFIIGCEERCYLANRAEIRKIADSWQIEEP